MRCFDKALELDPQQPEALVSKAVSLLVDFGKAEEAIPLFEFALRVASDIVTKWPHVWYWLAMAHQRIGNLEKALQCTEEGLEQQPGDRATRHLKSVLLEKLALKNPEFRERGINFWRTELSTEPRNYEARRQLVRALADTASIEAWHLVDESFKLANMKPFLSFHSLENSHERRKWTSAPGYESPR
jgi:tetratricopeptide (TPR) repeat protein